MRPLLEYQAAPKVLSGRLELRLKSFPQRLEMAILNWLIGGGCLFYE